MSEGFSSQHFQFDKLCPCIFVWLKYMKKTAIELPWGFDLIFPPEL
jgi:hypothetical protein